MNAIIRPPLSSTILRPGIVKTSPGRERYKVIGGGSLVVAVSAGDKLTLTDLQGGQPCELSLVDSKGNFTTNALRLAPWAKPWVSRPRSRLAAKSHAALQRP